MFLETIHLMILPTPYFPLPPKRVSPPHTSVSAMARPTASAAVYPKGGQGAHVHSPKNGRAQKKGRLWQTTIAGRLSLARFLAASS